MPAAVGLVVSRAFELTVGEQVVDAIQLRSGQRSLGRCLTNANALIALGRHRNARLAAMIRTRVGNSSESALAQRMQPLTILRLVMRYLWGSICVFALGIVPLVGCSSSEGPGGGQTEFTRFAYVASSRDDSVSAYAVDELTGGLHLLGTVAAGTTPWSVTIDPSGRFAYVANQLSDNVSQYRIGADGTLSPLTPPTAAAGTEPGSVAVDPSGQFAYVAISNGDKLSQYRIEDDGTLSALAPDNVAAGGAPLSVITVGGFE